MTVSVGEAEWVEVFETPRLARLPSFIKNACREGSLKLEISVDKGWFRETVRVKVTGPYLRLRALKWAIYSVIDDWKSP